MLLFPCGENHFITQGLFFPFLERKKAGYSLRLDY
jgi:hypothetical protein